MNQSASIVPISKTPVKKMLTPEEQKFVDLIANIFVNSVIKKAYEKKGHPVPEVQQ
jgi:hypothetical protein